MVHFLSGFHIKNLNFTDTFLLVMVLFLKTSEYSEIKQPENIGIYAVVQTCTTPVVSLLQSGNRKRGNGAGFGSGYNNRSF
jgi:hypothetical protein